MKNPCGYGSIIKKSGKRRRPYEVRVTIGWTDEGKQIRKIIGYFEKRTEAIEFLANYNKNPNIIDEKLTFEEVFERWSKSKFKNADIRLIRSYKLSFSYCEKLHEMRMIDIKTDTMQKVIDSCNKGYDTLKKIKVLLKALYRYSLQNDIVTKDYSQFVSIGKRTKESTRIPFTKEEIKKLFEVEKEIYFVDTILIMIYTGFRIGELLEIKKDNINLENKTITGGIKTEAGKNRIVPINKLILPFIEKRLKENNNYLIENSKGEKMKYDNYYRERWQPIMNKLGMKHKPHDCRHTFATLLNNADANQTSIKKLIGHNSFLTTEKIYTHKDIEELRKAIDLLK